MTNPRMELEHTGKKQDEQKREPGLDGGIHSDRTPLPLMIYTDKRCFQE